MPIDVPCGQCIGCRIERSKMWAARCYHEASLFEKNCFITLTYDNEHLPANGSLNKKHFQDFMKRLRFRFGSGIRFYMCGEYGETYGRPHYHACLFNFDFPDKKFFKKNNGNVLYTSEELQKLWTFGFSSIGAVTFQSAAYVARYIMKKITGKEAKNHYERFDSETGEVYYLQPEYTCMSRRPGIGKDWIKKYDKDTYKDDFVIINGKKLRPPRYYDNYYVEINPQHMEQIKIERELDALKYVDNNTKDRLRVREIVLKSKLKKLVRTID